MYANVGIHSPIFIPSHVQIVVGFFLIVCSAASIKCEDSGRCSQRSNACHPGRNPQVKLLTVSMAMACAMFAGGGVICMFKPPLGNLVGFLVS